MSVKLLTSEHVGFYVVTMTLDLKSGFLSWKFANNLDLDGTWVYAVVTRSAASPLISSCRHA